MRVIPLVLLLTAGVLAAGAGYVFHQHQSAETAAGAPAATAEAALAAGPPVPASAVLTDLDGATHHFADWHGKLLLVNFWATWCTPCLHEIPLLTKAQRDYAARGLQIIGPAIDDPDEVRKAAKGPLAIAYPVMTGSPEQMLGLLNDFGNTAGALPFTVLIGADGKVVHQQLGEFSAEELREAIEAHLPPR